MIESIYLKNYLSFDELSLDFGDGLNVFTGVSGAGKSIFFKAILSIMAIQSAEIDLGEIVISDHDLFFDEFLINAKEDFSIKQISDQKTRYYLNNQLISKKSLGQFTAKFFIYLHLKDTRDLNSESLIKLIDLIIYNKNKEFKTNLDEFKIKYDQLMELEKKLQKLLKNEQEFLEKKEFLEFEIDKINKINPKENEFEELKKLKEKISKKEKIKEIINDAMFILENSYKVSKVLELIQDDSSFFNEAVNEASFIIENFLNESDINEKEIEEIINRIEELSSLIKRYGGIKEALQFKEIKKKELNELENFDFEKEITKKKIEKLKPIVAKLAQKLSNKRIKFLDVIENELNEILNKLYLPNIKLSLKEVELNKFGIDKIDLKLVQANLKELSSGEFNRLRLAIFTLKARYGIKEKGVLFLDEIDANLSGKESESIALILKEISKFYQIFIISHQPHICSVATSHFLVYKQNNKSFIKKLDKTGQINEIARMVSGKKIQTEAIKFAEKLLYRQFC